jgi:N-acetylmuramoyl-L-alanine amidase
MSAKEPPQPPLAADEEELDIEALLELPAENGYFDCSVPEDFAPEGEEAPRPEQPIKARCLRDFTAIRTSGTRALSTIRWIVIHSTEGSSARSSAQWFTNPETQGSAQLVVDDRECYRTLNDDIIPWGAPGANTMGWHLELSGKAAWSRSQWRDHKKTLRRGAFKAAQHAKQFGIPIKMLSAADIRQGRKGFVTHALCTQAFNTPGGHTDPGSNCPLDEFIDMAKKFRAEM